MHTKGTNLAGMRKLASGVRSKHNTQSVPSRLNSSPLAPPDLSIIRTL